MAINAQHFCYGMIKDVCRVQHIRLLLSDARVPLNLKVIESAFTIG